MVDYKASETHVNVKYLKILQLLTQPDSTKEQHNQHNFNVVISPSVTNVFFPSPCLASSCLQLVDPSLVYIYWVSAYG